MKSLIAILMMLLFLSFAEAKTTALVPGKNAYANAKKQAINPRPQTQLDTILTHAQFLKLRKDEQETYVLELQRLVVELQKHDLEINTQYQTAQHWLQTFITEAVAADNEDRPCIYAGWISSMDINGRSCLRPKSDGCVRGKIQCNPMLYGADRCVPANRKATASCERAKKSISQIVSEIRGHEQEWSNMREEISNYCRDPRPTQARVCATVRNRLARIERAIGTVPPPRYDAPTPPGSSAAAEAASAEAVVVSPPRAEEARTEPAPVAAPSLSLTRASSNCNAATLLANLKPESSDRVGPSNFMDLESARTLMCSTQPIPQDWVIGQRDLISEATRAVRGSDKYAQADRRNYEGIIKNFNACVKDAETLRRTGAGSVTGSYASLVTTGTFVKMYDASNRPIVGLGSVYDLEGLLRAKGISICNLRTRDDVQLAPAYSGSTPGRPAPSSSTR